MGFSCAASASAVWNSFARRVKSAFRGADPRVCIAFWFFGLINNVLYVIILSAALDLVGPSIPKGLVLLADVIPSFFVKLVAPYFIHKVSYTSRIFILVLLSTCGMLLIALSPDYNDIDRINNGGSISIKLVGVMLASLSSGAGEASFVALVHYYGPFSLAAWGSGTGGAGLIGAGVYVLATTWWKFTVKQTLLTSAALPLGLLFSFFGVLPRAILADGSAANNLSRPVAQTRTSNVEDSDGGDEREGLLDDPEYTVTTRVYSAPQQNAWAGFWHNVMRAKALFFPYMLPLLLVYIAEYTINQGVAPTLLFPLQDTPFKEFRAFYPTYNALYQCGVFISRSSTPFFRIHNLYLPSFLQVLNLLILTTHSLYDFIPSVYIVFIIVFWEGLLGGLVYVNTFAEISDNISKEDREFSLGATTVSDSGGICIAGFISMILEVSLCSWQVQRGKNWCRQL